jgi:hypothetical protein
VVDRLFGPHARRVDVEVGGARRGCGVGASLILSDGATAGLHFRDSCGDVAGMGVLLLRPARRGWLSGARARCGWTTGRWRRGRATRMDLMQ